MFYRWIIERNGTWSAMASSLLCFQGIQRDPKRSKGPEAKRPSSPHSWKIKWNIWCCQLPTNQQRRDSEKKKNGPLWHVGYEFVTLVRLALGTTERGMPLAERFEWTGRSATMEEAYKARLRKLAWLVTSYPESDHRIISKPKWTSSLCMRWYSTGFCEALEDFAGQTSFRNAEWNQVTESNINLEPGHI